MPPHGANLIQDLGIVVAGAAIANILFTRLRLPVIFGYLAVGLLLGPGVMEHPLLGDTGSIQQVSELGVAFLLFFMGMEFDLSRLRKVMGSALLAVLAQTIVMLYLARLVSPLLGWGSISGLFFGSLLAISSSMVTMRVLREQGQEKAPHAQLAAGIMILEDVLAILLLVILSGVAVSKRFDWQALWLVSFLMGVFVIGVFFAGRIIASRLMSSAKGERNHETLTIASVGLALGIGALAIHMHFSEALGAFVAGAILSRTKIVHSVLEANRSLRDLFCAVFFVTIGLQIDPRTVLANFGWVLFLTMLMIVGKVASCHLGMFLAGQPPLGSYRASVVKAQIGEFSFVIAALGQQLGVTDGRLTSIAFGVALLSILLTPYLGAGAPAQYRWLAGHMPGHIKRFASFYRNYLDTILAHASRNAIFRTIRSPLTHIALHFFLLSGVILGGAFLARWVSRLDIPDPVVWGLCIWVCTAFLAVPFAISITRYVSSIVFMVTEAAFANVKGRGVFKGRVNNLVNTLTTFLALLLMGGFFLSVASPFLPRGAALLLFAVLVVGVGIFFWRNMIKINSRLEHMFIDSFETARVDDSARQEETIARIKGSHPWPADLREVRIPRGSPAAGRRIRELNLTGSHGCMIVALMRSGMELIDPGPDTPLFPDDTLFLLGPTDGNARAAAHIEQAGAATERSAASNIGMHRAILAKACELDGNTLAGANIRRRFGVSVVGIQRGEQQIISPGADEILKSGDMLLYVASDANAEAFMGCTQNPETAKNTFADMPPPTEAARPRVVVPTKGLIEHH
jgi:CPA2 family monovalent cation:H+ antiporter-2